MSEFEEEYSTFVMDVVQSQKIYGLEGQDEAWAMCESAGQYEDAKGNPLEFDTMAFWSSDALAKVCAVDDWSTYKVAIVDLADFLENWCIGAYQDAVLMGINWDENCEGEEVHPLQLALDLIEACEEEGVVVKFEDFEDIMAYREAVETILNATSAN